LFFTAVLAGSLFLPALWLFRHWLGMWVGVWQVPKRQNAKAPKAQKRKSAKAPKRQRAKEPKRQKRQSAKSAKEQTHHVSPHGSESCFLAELVNSEQLSLF
jgi:type II secretory pathway component PulL